MALPGDGARSNYGSYWGGALTEAILNGTIPQWRLDDMVVRIMSAFYKVGRDGKRVPINYSSWVNTTTGYRYFASKMGNTTVNQHVDVQDDHSELIREIGAKGTALLKNNNTLPLKRPLSIAIVGEDAQDNPGGPNACVDRICNTGTLAMGWGSATAKFPYLVAPATALQARAEVDDTAFTNVKSNYDLDAARVAARNASVAIVFANANGGEGYVTLDGNFGDRKNLTLWNNGDELISAVASVNSKTVVVIHSVGPVLIDHIKRNPNVTAILWAVLPGQESGNSLVDVLYGAVNPQGRTPFTWGKKAGDWGITTLTNATTQMPDQDFDEGVFIDYRYFDREGIEPSWEFGFGLSYTDFKYSSLTIEAANLSTHEPTTGETAPAPTFGTIDKNTTSALTPDGFQKIPKFIYPWINSSDLPSHGNVSLPEGGLDDSPQPLLPAGGAPGGHPGLYETMFTVSASITNSGELPGTDVPQVVSHAMAGYV